MWLSKLFRGLGFRDFLIRRILWSSEHWVENEIEYTALKKLGIKSRVCPSFLGEIDDYKISYKYNKKPKVYTSVSGDRFELYGWDNIDALARRFPDIEFHLYGNKSRWGVANENIIVHGRVSKERMNREIKQMQGALRLLPFEGASEIVVKAMLWGHYCFSSIDYPGTNSPSELNLLLSRKSANIKYRDWWLKNLNQYPWNINTQK